MVFFARKRAPVPVNSAGVARAEWVLPVGATTPSILTSVGTIDSAWPVTVDGRGLVSVPLGHPGLRPWSLDWWVGADDRWHLPSKETGVRQRLVDGAPVVETRMRIPSGDAVQRVFGVRGPAYPTGEGTGDEYVVVEVHNDSAVPFAMAFVVRPFGADGTAAMMNGFDLVPVAGGVGADVAHAVAVDGRAVLLLPRKPSRVAGSVGGVDVAELVTGGGAPDELGEVGRGSQPTVAVLFPVPHTATLRVLLPLGVAPGIDPPFPSGLPPAERVAAGWAIQTGRGARVEVPDTGMAEAVHMARASLLLVARVDRGLDPEIVVGLDREGLHDDAAAHLARWPQRLLAHGPEPVEARAALRAIIEHWRLTRDRESVEVLLPEISALAASLPRAVPKQAPPELRARQASALRGLADLLEGLDQPAAAAAARAEADGLAPDDGSLSAAMAFEADDGTVDRPVTAGSPLGGEPESELWKRVRRLVSVASPTWAWPGGAAAAAAFLAAVRAVLVAEQADGLALLPGGFGPWWGQAVELHDAPTGFGTLSFAIRWHGDRPAVLWDFTPHHGLGGTTLRAPVVDPAWNTCEPRGEALLAAVPRPPGWVAPTASVVAAGQGKAESVAPRSVLPLAPSPARPEAHEPPGEAPNSGEGAVGSDEHDRSDGQTAPPGASFS